MLDPWNFPDMTEKNSKELPSDPTMLACGEAFRSLEKIFPADCPPESPLKESLLRQSVLRRRAARRICCLATGKAACVSDSFALLDSPSSTLPQRGTISTDC